MTHDAPTHDRDLTDPLAAYPGRFIQTPGVVAYLDGNSLGRPLAVTPGRFDTFIRKDWGDRLIRSWDEQWFERPLTLGDRLGALVLGAATGQTMVGDSTTVMLYKFMRAAVDARPGRTEIVLDDDNFPTDRFLAEGIAAERGLTLTWITVDRTIGVTPDQVRNAVGPATALVILSHVAYRSGYLADMPLITSIVHEAGALVLWDLCHSAGVIPTELDAWGVDLAVGCTYKYLNGGPGSPAFGYVRADLQKQLEQPIQGWMGAGDVFAMAPSYEPAQGMRRFLSGTPPIVGMLALDDMLDAIEDAGVTAIREKSIALTEYAISLIDELLVPLGAELVSPRDATQRGSHVTVRHPAFRQVTGVLWERGVIPDFRAPDGLRIGLSPLSTTYAEVHAGIEAARAALAELT